MQIHDNTILKIALDYLFPIFCHLVIAARLNFKFNIVYMIISGHQLIYSYVSMIRIIRLDLPFHNNTNNRFFKVTFKKMLISPFPD